MITVCIESPLAGDIETNTAYARACLLYCLQRDVAPFASHLLYTQVLDDQSQDDRTRGMKAGFTMGDQCDQRWVFTDLGISRGMKSAITRAERLRQPIHEKSLGDDWQARYSGDERPTVGFTTPDAPADPPADPPPHPDTTLEVE